MAYDEGLAQRIRDLMPGAKEKAMFGGVAWMDRGNLVVGVLGEEMVARVGKDDTEAALAQEGVRPFAFTGRAMAGWVLVAPEAIAEDDDLALWVARCHRFTDTLPSK
ncbi:MAG: hypothetical protein QOD77_1159 [Thermoplasmata archaeon]|nr:hypothetical protein [Thermoplasmata archaeon]